MFIEKLPGERITLPVVLETKSGLGLWFAHLHRVCVEELQEHQWDHVRYTQMEMATDCVCRAKLQASWNCPYFWSCKNNNLGDQLSFFFFFFIRVLSVSDLNNLCRAGVVNWHLCSLNRNAVCLSGIFIWFTGKSSGSFLWPVLLRSGWLDHNGCYGLSKSMNCVLSPVSPDTRGRPCNLFSLYTLRPLHVWIKA